MALGTNGIVSCWGKSNEGQLGANGRSALDIAGARENSYIVTTAGTLRAWGTNLAGEGSPSGGDGFVQVAGDYMHGYALRDNGTIAGWGMNYYGAVNIPSDDDYLFLAAGERSGYALRFQPGWLECGSGEVTSDGDGFSAGGFTTQGLGAATPLAFTVSVDNLVLDAGMATLTVDYDPVEIASAGIVEDSLRLHWWDEGLNSWSLAGRYSNNDNTMGQFVIGAPTSTLGDWGIDMAGNYVWANIDHASTYSLAGEVIPEPTMISLVALSGLLMLRRKKR